MCNSSSSFGTSVPHAYADPVAAEYSRDKYDDDHDKKPKKNGGGTLVLIKSNVSEESGSLPPSSRLNVDWIEIGGCDSECITHHVEKAVLGRLSAMVRCE